MMREAIECILSFNTAWEAASNLFVTVNRFILYEVMADMCEDL